MRRTVLVFLILTALSLPLGAQTAPASESRITDEMLNQIRVDSQKARSDVIAKNITLSAEEAAKFWPLLEKYQKEQNVVIDEQLKGVQQYVNGYETLDDAAALSLMNANFDRDQKMTALRKKWLAEFQKILPAKTAVRVMQIDRALSLAMQTEMAARIPLVK